MTLWEIRTAVLNKYKDGKDWIYPKAKKAEVEIIKSLLEISDKLSQENYNLREQLEVLDEWEAYGKAEHELDSLRQKFEEMSVHADNFSKVVDQWNEANKTLEESEKYILEIAKKIGATHD